MTSITTLAVALAAAEPSTPAEWGMVGVLAAVVGKAGWDLILRLLPNVGTKKEGGSSDRDLTTEEREYFRRLEETIREIRDRVQRLDDLHQVRRADGMPAFYCTAHVLEPRITEIQTMLGRLLDDQRQSRGLLSRIAKALKISIRKGDPK